MTLIDKAEALAAIKAWFAETKSFAPPSLLDAIAAIPPAKQEHVADSNARGVGVKPLVWEGDEEERHDLIARPDPFHTYTVRPLGDARFDVILNHELGSLWFRQRKGEIWPDYTSAKAAAQADYEARVFAALEPAPTDAAQAREAAAEIQRWWEDNSDNREPTPLILALIGEAP